MARSLCSLHQVAALRHGHIVCTSLRFASLLDSEFQGHVNVADRGITIFSTNLPRVFKSVIFSQLAFNRVTIRDCITNTTKPILGEGVNANTNTNISKICQFQYRICFSEYHFRRSQYQHFLLECHTW